MALTEQQVHAQRRGIVARADLLEALQRESLDWFDLPSSADERPGFQRIAEGIGRIANPSPRIDVGTSESITESSAPLRMTSCWAVTDVDRDDATSQSAEADPAPLVQTEPAPRASREHSDRAAKYWTFSGVQRAWSRQHPQLRRLIQPVRVERRSRVDWDEAVRRIARGKALLPLPQRRQPRWPANLVLVLDRDSVSMTPLVGDMDGLTNRLRRTIGDRAVDLRVLQSGHDKAFETWSRPRKSARREARRGKPQPPQQFGEWQPLFGGQMLLVSDLAAAPQDEHRRAGFERWLRQMTHGGTEILLLSHVVPPPGVLPTRARRMPWFPNAPLVLPGTPEPPELADLLALVALIGSVSDVLLRALAEIVQPGPPPLGLIWSAWNHQQMRIVGRHCKLNAEAVERYRQRLSVLSLDTLRRADEIRRLLQAPLPTSDEHLCVLRMLCLAPRTRILPESAQAEAAALSWLASDLPDRLHAATTLERPWLEALVARIIDIAHPLVRATHRTTFQRLQRMVAAEALRRGESVKTYPELGPATLEPTPDAQPARRWKLLRQIDRVRLTPVDATEPGILLATDLQAPASSGVHLHAAGHTRWIATADEPVNLADLATESSPLAIRIGRCDVRLERFSRPTWASGWGHTSAGLRVRIATPWASEAELPWPCPPNYRAESSHKAAHFAFGVDGYGLFLDLSVRKVTQRLRWIEPGEFLMGSPENEPERDTYEGPQHRVRLSEGFWLADSACTQALWLAVMAGKNPSHFDDDLQCPVEQVSWDDVQIFLQRLQTQLPASSAPMLPSEAQWEYACRAGTPTPFNLGENITPEQVNYDGNHPYNGARKGEYRQRTAPVKSLPANAWGLYEMHGNVWEWCADGMRKYEALPPGEVLRDPLRPTESVLASRALRGGSWFDYAWFVRSALRYASPRDDRYGVVGFRLALRSTSPVGPEGA